MICRNVCDTWYYMVCKELDHTLTHNTNVYICLFYIEITFTDIF